MKDEPQHGELFENLLIVYQYFVISDLFILRWIVGLYFTWLNIVCFYIHILYGRLTIITFLINIYRMIIC